MPAQLDSFVWGFWMLQVTLQAKISDSTTTWLQKFHATIGLFQLKQSLPHFEFSSEPIPGIQKPFCACCCCIHNYFQLITLNNYNQYRRTTSSMVRLFGLHCRTAIPQSDIATSYCHQLDDSFFMLNDLASFTATPNYPSCLLSRANFSRDEKQLQYSQFTSHCLLIR